MKSKSHLLVFLMFFFCSCKLFQTGLREGNSTPQLETVEYYHAVEGEKIEVDEEELSWLLRAEGFITVLYSEVSLSKGDLKVLSRDNDVVILASSLQPLLKYLPANEFLLLCGNSAPMFLIGYEDLKLEVYEGISTL